MFPWSRVVACTIAMAILQYARLSMATCCGGALKSGAQRHNDEHLNSLQSQKLGCEAKM